MINWLAAQVIAHPWFFLTVAISLSSIALSLIAVACAVPRRIHVVHRPPDEPRERRRLEAIVEVERRPRVH